LRVVGDWMFCAGGGGYAVPARYVACA